MLPLVLVALAGIVVLVERLAFVIRRSRVNPRPFMERVISLARSRKYDEALALCAEHHAVLPDVGIIVLRSREASAEDLAMVAKAARDSFVPALHRRHEWLLAAAAILGLLGVAGAAANYNDVIGSNAASDALGEALGYALRPLAAAALLAIPLVAGWAYLRHAALLITEHIEEFEIRLINAVADRPEVRLGHRD